MTKHQKLKGIVISYKRAREADRLYSIFTTERGLIKVVARSASKSKSKLAGKLELFNLINVELVKGKTFDIITGVDLLRVNYKDNMEHINMLYIMAEVIEKIMPEGQPSPDLNLVIRKYFAAANKKSLLYTLALLIRREGFLPEIDSLKISDSVKKLLLASGKFDLDKFCRINAGGALFDEARNLLLSIVEEELGLPLKSRVFVL